MDQPLLSIIIPTRNRSRYAISAVESVLSIQDSRVELVVHDNSSDGKLQELIEPFRNDTRLVYVRCTEALDVVENFTRAYQASKGFYCTFIGDDDGVNPEIVCVASWGHSNAVDGIITTMPCEYSWPDVNSRYATSRLAGRLDIRKFSGGFQQVDPESELLRCAVWGGELPLNSGLPRAYHGIVARHSMERAYKLVGSYFPGPSPDLAVAIALAGVVERLWLVDYPLILQGTSMGNVHARGRSDFGNLSLEEKPHIPKKYVREWSTLVPKFFSGPTVWGETAIQALMASGRDDIIRKFNFAYMYAKCIVFTPSQAKSSFANYLKISRQLKKNLPWAIVRLLVGFLFVWKLRFQFLIYNLMRAFLPGWICESHTNVENIKAAIDCLEASVRDRGKPISALVPTGSSCVGGPPSVDAFNHPV